MQAAKALVSLYISRESSEPLLLSLISAKINCSLDHLQQKKELLFVFVALRPMSTAMVIAGRSVHLTTLFPGQA